MHQLYIQGTENTPEVNFSPESGIFNIVGKSIPEDADAFYKPILEWFDDTFFSFSMRGLGFLLLIASMRESKKFSPPIFSAAFFIKRCMKDFDSVSKLLKLHISIL